MSHNDPWAQAKKLLGAKAALTVESGMLVGIGSGSTVGTFIEALGQRVQNEHVIITCVVASRESEARARRKGLVVRPFNGVKRLDYAIDGADAVNPQGVLVKGGGGALVREKLLLASAFRSLILVDPSKLVPSLARVTIAVAVVPFGWRHVASSIMELGAQVTLRRHNGRLFVTDDELCILDCRWDTVFDVDAMHYRLKAVVGVVEIGLFIGYHPRVWVSDGVTVSDALSGGLIP